MIAIIITGSLVAGVYGILHDQITFSIAPEYFTRFKFIQFRHFIPLAGPDRFNVSVIGFLATYWVGTFISFVLGLVNWIMGVENLYRKTLKAFLLVLLVTFCSGVIGFIAGRIVTGMTPVGRILSWNIYFPDGLQDVKGFMTVGFIHDFSYLGGLAGLIAGIIWQIKTRKK